MSSGGVSPCYRGEGAVRGGRKEFPGSSNEPGNSPVVSGMEKVLSEHGLDAPESGGLEVHGIVVDIHVGTMGRAFP